VIPLGNDPKLYRSFVVSRQILIDSRFPTVVCAPLLTRGHGFSTQVSVGIDEGLKHESWILCDNLVSLRRVQLTRFVGSLARSKVEELDQALKRALALE
jgi:mRNA interferase MazF